MTSSSSKNDAHIVALQVVAWLGATDDLLLVFTGSTGLDPADLQGRLDDAEFLAAAMDFLFQDDLWVVKFMEENAISPELLRLTRAALPGGDTPFWT